MNAYCIRINPFVPYLTEYLHLFMVEWRHFWLITIHGKILPKLRVFKTTLQHLRFTTLPKIYYNYEFEQKAVSFSSKNESKTSLKMSQT